MIIGISHQYTNSEIRGKVALTGDMIRSYLDIFNKKAPNCSIVILSTCNRIEIYSDRRDPSLIINLWASLLDLDTQELENEIYILKGTEAIEHLFKVACGLDSIILGEHQILGQLKLAFALSKEFNVLKKPLHQLFESCFTTAKEVRSKVIDGGNFSSVGQSAAFFINSLNLTNKIILLIGAGHTIELVLEHLKKERGATFILNRTKSRADEVAKKFNIQSFDWSLLPFLVNKVDIIISATSSVEPILKKDLFSTKNPKMIIDLAIPSDVEKSLKESSWVDYINIDSFKKDILIPVSAEQEKYKKQASNIINKAVGDFLLRFEQRKDLNQLISFRTHAENLSLAIKKQALKKIAKGQDPFVVIDELTHKLTQALLHQPSMALKEFMIKYPSSKSHLKIQYDVIRDPSGENS
jgi:glutamyl-tRNA reductase